jgi:hypothetical protein
VRRNWPNHAMKKESTVSRSTTNLMPLAVVLASLVVTTASVAAAEGASPAVSVDGLADVVRLAVGGDPVAYGRLWAYSNRCNIDPELAGAAAGRVASSAMRTGQVRSLEDFFAKAQPGLRQGNSAPRAAINCVATREGLLDLAGCRRQTKFDPPRQSNIDPGMDANRVMVSCG